MDMNVMDKFGALNYQVQVLAQAGYKSAELDEAVTNFLQLWDSPEYVSTEEFEAAIGAVDGAIDDLCIANRINGDWLEQGDVVIGRGR